MKRRYLYVGAFLLGAFVLWTVMVCNVDVRAVGPCNSSVGFATLNTFFHSLTGVNLSLYVITDWLGLVPVAVALGFTVFGFAQMIKRKSFLAVDKSILILGIFYIAVIFSYLFFEYVALNYRPILISGYLEASYPSSTILLVSCVMPTAIMQLNFRIKRKGLRRCISVAISAFTVFMVLARMISGVHWLTDVVGGALLSVGMVALYSYFAYTKN